ncbi:VWA domain-containing protein [Inquilinus sp. CAU 1745]|uniref:vWA domain-containing protein n=1 Tax=Inquilinus sp. CAU 1745 TaxID=3140369 RepID=UPI00325AB1C0
MTEAPTGQLANNVMEFCRVLRAAGLPVGPGRTLAALEAAETVGVASRQDFYWALHAAIVTRRDQRAVFDQAFHIFWRNPDLLRRALQTMLPGMKVDREGEEEQINRRLAEAFAMDRRPGEGESPEDGEPELEIDASLTFSDRELLQKMDFEQMTTAEIERAKALIARMTLPARPMRTRRFRPDAAGPAVDLRRTLKASLRGGGGAIDLARKRRATRPPPLVALCDISGSMSRYSRMLLHFLHAVTNDRDRVHNFVFGTRLTNITRHLRHRDVDRALSRVGEAVEDWSGGTRIGGCLEDFNRIWSRRVLGQGAVALLITDGLDREAGDRLDRAMERLHKSCRRLIWLNPLLRYDGYAPKSQGARAMIPHVDDFRPVHSLDSLADLVDALDARPQTAQRHMAQWRMLAEEARG